MKLLITLAFITAIGAAIYALSLRLQNRQKRLAPAKSHGSHSPGSPGTVIYGSDGGGAGGGDGGGC